MWGSFTTIMEEQYILARKCNISPLDSDQMVDFERTIFVTMVIKEIEKEIENMDKKR